MPVWSRRRALRSLFGATLAACEGTTRTAGPRIADASTTPESAAQTPASQSMGPSGLGSLDDLAPAARVAFTDGRGFARLPPPRAHEWRAIRPEPAQSVDDFLAAGLRRRARPRDTLVLLPLGRFPYDVIEGPDFVGLVRTPPTADLADLLTAFFATTTTILAGDDFPAADVPYRELRGHRQFAAPAILRHVAARAPDDAYGMITLVNVDLFAWNEQEFAFGFSVAEDRLGVVGFSRYDPSFFGGARPDDLDGAILRRSARVLVHECGHLFGLAHCQHFRCVMNGVSDLAEIDRLPMHLCPVCLRKLQLVTDLDPTAYYRGLAPIVERLGLLDEARWLARRLAILDAAALG